MSDIGEEDISPQPVRVSREANTRPFLPAFVRYAYSGHRPRLLDAMMSTQKLRKSVLNY